jgi:hypothetical protein
MLYHASPDELDEFLDFTSLAYNPEDALGYLQDSPGYLYTVRVKPGLKVADEEDIQAAADELDDPILKQEDFVFALADDWKVRDALAEAGFDAMAYEDVGPNNEYEHDTLVVFNADNLEIVEAERIVNARIAALCARLYENIPVEIRYFGQAEDYYTWPADPRQRKSGVITVQSRNDTSSKVDLNSLRDLYLLELAKYPTFEKAYEAYRHGLRGLYWHVTDDPDFYIDPNKGPRDMSSMSAGRSMEKGKLMVTPDLADWADYYDERDYVALIDLSNVGVDDYADTTRGFGSEIFVHDLTGAEVIEVLDKEKAQRLQDKFDSDVIAYSAEELHDHWERARGTKYACVRYQTNREAFKDLELMYDKYGYKKVREIYEDARKSKDIKQAVQYVKEVLQTTKRASYRDRDAGKAEVELERLFAELLPGTKFEGKVFAVGGYVRDQLQHREPADLDMVVEMPYGAQRFAGFLLDEFPDKLSEPEPLTYKLPIWNMHFIDDVTYNGELYRVSGAELDLTDTQTLQRLDGELDTAYGPISDDVLRRDYTVNMLYKDLTSGEILDPTGTGQTDIERGVLRARPDEDVIRAFEQQPKRMLRLVRFMAQYDWQPDPEIEQAIYEAVGSLAEISGRSLQKEFNKWKKRGILDTALQFARDYGMLPPLRKAWQTAKIEEVQK